MGEINLPSSAPKASSDSLELGRNSSSVQVAPSVFFLGCFGSFLQHLAVGLGRNRGSGAVELWSGPLQQFLGSHVIWALGQVEAWLRQRNKARLSYLFVF